MDRHYPTPETESVHAIKYKFLPTEKIKNYISQCEQKVKLLSRFCKDGLVSQNENIREFVDILVRGNVKIMAANLAPYFFEDRFRHRSKNVELRNAKDIALQLQRGGILPLDELRRDVACQVFHSALSYFQSWYKCDQLARDQHKKWQSECEEKQCDVDVGLYGKFEKWVDHCENKEFFNLSPRVAKYISNGNLWRYNAEVNQSIFKMFPEWDKVYRDTNLLTFFTCVKCFVRSEPKKCANWTMPGETATLNIKFMNSLPKMQLAWNGNNPIIDVSINGELTGLKICVGNSGYANQMIKDVTVNHVEACKYRIEYSRYGIRFSGYCKSVSLHQKDGNYYAQLSLQFSNQPAVTPYKEQSIQSRGDTKGLIGPNYAELKRTLDRYRTAYDGESASEIRVMSVDVGVNCLAAYSVYDQRNGKIRRFAGGLIGGDGNPKLTGKLDYIKTCIFSLRGDVKLYSSIILVLRKLNAAIRTGKGLTKALKMVNDLPEWKGDDERSKYRERIFDIAKKINRQNAIEFLDQVKELQQLGFRERAVSLKNRVNKLRLQRLFSGNPDGNWLQYAKVLRDLRRVLMKLHCCGGDSEHTKNDRGNLFVRLLKQYSKFRRNLLKKLVANISAVARNNNVHVVVAEDLQHFKMSLSRTSHDNDLLSLWSPQVLMNEMKSNLSIFGIGFDLVDPRHTSQIDPATGEFGYRERFNRKNLWVVRSGKCVSIHADQAGADNIAIRYLCRHSDLFYCRATPVDNCLLLVSGEFGKIGVRMQGALRKLTGKSYAKLVRDGEGFRLYPLLDGQYQKLFAKIMPENGILDLYKHHDLFYTKEKHCEMVDAIARQAGVYKKDQACLRRRPKFNRKKKGGT